MSPFPSQENMFGSSSHYLSPSISSSRKSPSKLNITNRRSTASLRGSSNLARVVNGGDDDDDDAANGRHSLAHELAVAMMPEPSAGSKLLAEEFGIEYDEGAEGIDEDVRDGMEIVVGDEASYHTPSFAEEIGTPFHSTSPLLTDDTQDEFDRVFATPSSPKQKQRPEQDAMEVLAHDLESTDKFLLHLRQLDVDTLSSISQQPALERIASEVIRRLNDAVRNREGQVRELLEYEREFRKIAGEIGGSDVLGQLEELTQVADLSEEPAPQPSIRHVDLIEEEPAVAAQLTHDWELDPDRHQLGDEDDYLDPVSSPVKDSFPPPPPINGQPTPAQTIPQLAHLRSFTSSLVTSLTTISEQAQVNGAATTEAGRKFRALKNKIGGWRTEWDSAERSRLKIERWEAGISDEDSQNSLHTMPTRPLANRRIDGRKFVAEHLQAFELALADAAVKTKAIMAR